MQPSQELTWKWTYHPRLICNQEVVAMKNERLKVVRESENVFRDLGHKNADAEQLAADPETWLAELKKIPADPEFMKERRQPKLPKRTVLK